MGTDKEREIQWEREHGLIVHMDIQHPNNRAFGSGNATYLHLYVFVVSLLKSPVRLWRVVHQKSLVVFPRNVLSYGLIYYGCQPISMQGSNHSVYNNVLFYLWCRLLCYSYLDPRKSKYNNAIKECIRVQLMTTRRHHKMHNMLLRWWLSQGDVRAEADSMITKHLRSWSNKGFKWCIKHTVLVE